MNFPRERGFFSCLFFKHCSSRWEGKALFRLLCFGTLFSAMFSLCTSQLFISQRYAGLCRRGRLTSLPFSRCCYASDCPVLH